MIPDSGMSGNQVFFIGGVWRDLQIASIVRIAVTNCNEIGRFLTPHPMLSNIVGISRSE